MATVVKKKAAPKASASKSDKVTTLVVGKLYDAKDYPLEKLEAMGYGFGSPIHTKDEDESFVDDVLVESDLDGFFQLKLI